MFCMDKHFMDTIIIIAIWVPSVILPQTTNVRTMQISLGMQFLRSKQLQDNDGHEDTVRQRSQVACTEPPTEHLKNWNKQCLFSLILLLLNGQISTAMVQILLESLPSGGALVGLWVKYGKILYLLDLSLCFHCPMPSFFSMLIFHISSMLLQSLLFL